ncbi:hypothetical protein BJX70DRAFT_400304 [Aspergillus crustosus]
MAEAKHKLTTIPSGVLTVTVGYTLGLSLPDPTSETWREHWGLYVIAEYEGFQLSSEALNADPTEGSVTWIAGQRPFRFDVFPSLKEKDGEEVTLLLFVSRRDSDASGNLTSPAVSLGRVKLNPSLLCSGRRTNIQDGTGIISLGISYTQKEISTAVSTWSDWRVSGKETKQPSHRGHVYVEKVESGRSYGLETVDVPSSIHLNHRGNLAASLALCAGIKHPFIAPLILAFVLWRMAAGWIFFHYSQAEDTFPTTCRDSDDLALPKQDSTLPSWSACWNICTGRTSFLRP